MDPNYNEQILIENGLTIQEILEEYHHKILMENLVGPAISLVTHIVALLLMTIFIASKPPPIPPTIEVSIIEDVVKEIEPEVLDEIKPEVESEQEIPSTEVSDAPTEDPGANTSIADFSDNMPQTDDDMDTQYVMDTIANNSPLQMAGIYGGRSNEGRKKAAKKYGASGAGQVTVTKALAWLARVQDVDGSWGNQSPAHTGFALLTFLAHGETPLSETYGTTVQKAIKWMVDKEMSTANGDMGQNAYGHGIATYSLCEAYGMTRIPFVRTAMERALDVIIKGQQPGGGFNYGYSKGDRWDTSVSGWQCQALKAGYVAGATNVGLEDAIKKAITFLRRTAYANYKFGYSNNPGTGGNMTGIGVVDLQLMGVGDCPEAQGGLVTITTERFGLYQQIFANPGKWDEIAGPNMYGFYYDTQGVFNGQNRNAGAWKEWRNVYEKVLIRAQNPEGYWELKSGWGAGHDLPGRVMVTCQACLQMEVFYRYLPTFDSNKMDEYKIKEGENIENVGAGANNVIEIH